MAKFVHTADWQLGFQRAFLSDETQALYTRARLDAVKRCAELAKEQQADFMVVAGDVFESNLVDRKIVVQALSVLGGFTVPVYLLPGNHDPLDPSSIYRSDTFLEKKPDNVHVIDDDQPIEVKPGLELVGVPWLSRQPSREPTRGVFEKLPLAAPGTLRIGVAHGRPDTLPTDNDHPPLETSRLAEAVEQGRLHYIALGDHHSTHELTPRVWYSGTQEPTRFTEKDPGNALLVELTQSDCKVMKHPVGEWRFIETRKEMHTEEDLEGLKAWFDAIEDPPRTILRLHLEGSVSLDMKARLEEFRLDQEDGFAALDWRADPKHLLVKPQDEDLEALELSGFARDAFDDLQDRLQSDPDQTTEDALVLLYSIVKRRVAA